MYYTLLTDNTAESVTENIQQEVATQTSFAVDFFHENLPKAINFGVGVVFALIFFDRKNSHQLGEKAGAGLYRAISRR